MCFSLAGVISANKGIAGKLYDGLGERDCGVLTDLPRTKASAAAPRAAMCLSATF